METLDKKRDIQAEISEIESFYRNFIHDYMECFRDMQA